MDDKPYGGGPGMVIRAEPILKAVEKAISVAQKFSSGPRFSSPKSFRSSARPFRKLLRNSNINIIYILPSAEIFTTEFGK